MFIVAGVVFVGLNVEAIWTGGIKLGKHDSSEHLYSSTNPLMFSLACAVSALLAAWAFSSARDQYLMHGK